MQQSLPDRPNHIVLEAIARQTCVEATYNGGRVRLAPHILFTRHDALFVDALTIARDGRPPRESRLGTFKLLGLRGLTLAPQPFEPSPDFDPEDPKYCGAKLFAVEPRQA